MSTASHADAHGVDGEQVQSSSATIGRERPSYERLGAVAAGVVALALVFQFPAHALERRLGLVPVHEPFTELYFAHPGDLPTAVRAAQVLRVPFVIDNREGRPETYRWSAVALDGSGRSVLESGALRVGDNRAALVPLELRGARLQHSSTVEIRLERPAQWIDVHLAAR